MSMKQYIKPSVNQTAVETEEAVLAASQMGVVDSPMDWENALSNEQQSIDVWD